MNNTIWNDKHQVLAAVNKTGGALRYASEELKKDKDVVLAAVNQNGLSLIYALEELKKDKDVVLAAVNQDGHALVYASEQLQNDLELLNLLYCYHNLTENKIEDKNFNYQKWFDERMKIRDILIEEEIIQKYIPNKNKPVKSRNLKF